MALKETKQRNFPPSIHTHTNESPTKKTEATTAEILLSTLGGHLILMKNLEDRPHAYSLRERMGEKLCVHKSVRFLPLEQDHQKKRIVYFEGNVINKQNIFLYKREGHFII